ASIRGGAGVRRARPAMGRARLARCGADARARYRPGVARAERRVAENAPGVFFVDDSCIDCDTCRVVAPSIFGEGDQSFVARQPPTDEDPERAQMALLACPHNAT